MTRRSSRRQFLAQVGIGGAALSFAAPRIARAAGVNEKLNVGFVGAGGQAGAHTEPARAGWGSTASVSPRSTSRNGTACWARRAGRRRWATPTGGRCSRSTPRTWTWSSSPRRTTAISPPR